VLVGAFRSRALVEAENTILRHQLNVLRRQSPKRPTFGMLDRLIFMTGAAARALKLADRGLLKAGYRADVTVFDPADFNDRATYENPHQYPSGCGSAWLLTPIGAQG
jgi:N-acyl-D-aspartate/D-glutamate deacylase